MPAYFHSAWPGEVERKKTITNHAMPQHGHLLWYQVLDYESRIRRPVVASNPPCFPHSRVMEPIRRYVKPLSMLALFPRGKKAGKLRKADPVERARVVCPFLPLIINQVKSRERAE